MSGPCLSADLGALVLAASKHNTNASNIIGTKLKLFGYGFEAYRFLSLASLIRKGFRCRFSSDHSWEANVTQTWSEPFERDVSFLDYPVRLLGEFFVSAAGTLDSLIQPKEIDMKLTTGMITSMGFTSFKFGNEALQEHDNESGKSKSKKVYVGVSGGGWRALAGHMGAFRALSNKNVLSTVDTFSSVSGGTWFLSKLAFDEKFSAKVLGNETNIGEDVLEWMERDYFPVIRNATPLHQNEQNLNQVASFLTTLVTQAPAPVRAALSTGIVAANHFHFSWQELVEQAVLGQGIISDKPLARTKLANAARAKFGQATLAFNWNQLHQWESPSTCSKWFLKHTSVPYVVGDIYWDSHAQYPIYTSAFYQQRLSDDNISFNVTMQGKPMNNLFDVCYKKNEAFCGSNTSIISDPNVKSACGKFEFHDLTVGQVVSASSAAVGGGAVRSWVQSIIELVRRKAKDALKGSVNVLYCSQYRMLIENLLGPCNRKTVLKEFFELLGCETDSVTKEDSKDTAKRWVGFLQKMAVQMAIKSPLASDHQGYMAIDAVIVTELRQTHTRTQRTHKIRHKH